MSVKKLKEKVDEKLKNQVKIDVSKSEMIKVLSEASRIAKDQGICISKEFMTAASGTLVMLKELPWMEEHEIVFHSPETIHKLEAILRTIPSDEELEFILKDNFLIVKSEKREVKFKCSTKLLLVIYNKMISANIYETYSKLNNGAYIELSKEKFSEINKVADTIGAEKYRFSLNNDKTEIDLKLFKDDSSEENETSLQYSENGFNIKIDDTEKDLKAELKDIETFLFAADVFSSIPAQNFKFYFNIAEAGILECEDGTLFALGKLRN